MWTGKIYIFLKKMCNFIMCRSVIVTSLGAEEELSCNVHAYPKPSVTWMKVRCFENFFLF